MALKLMTVSGRWPSNVATPTSSDQVQIQSGVCVVLPNSTSAVFQTLSCLGTGSAIGQIGIVAGQAYNTIVKGNVILGNFISVTSMERQTGTTELPRGGGIASVNA